MTSYKIFDKKNSYKSLRNADFLISWTNICIFIPEVLALSSPLYAHCKMLEFKVDLFRSIIYDMQSNEDKQEHHAIATKILSADARKCSSCGSGHFLQVPSKEKTMEVKSQLWMIISVKCIPKIICRFKSIEKMNFSSQNFLFLCRMYCLHNILLYNRKGASEYLILKCYGFLKIALFTSKT